MKVLHIITSLSDGGAQAVLYRLCMHDAHDQHVVLSLMDEGKYGPMLRDQGIQVVATEMSTSRLGIWGLCHLFYLVRRQNAEIVQTWMYHADFLGGLAAKLSGRRVVWGIHHSTLEPGKSKSSTFLVVRLCALLSRFVPARIICCSQRAGTLHGNLGYSKHKIDVIPNGYDVKDFAPRKAARKRLRYAWGVDVSTPLIGMVARFNPQKDHQNLIAALGKLKRAGEFFRCALVGAGMSRNNNELRQWLDTHNITSWVLLYENRSDIPDLMNAFDLHVLSSAYGEAFPNVINEAMSCGTPCVTTDVGDAALIVGDTGWVVPPSDAQQLYRAMQLALNAWRDGAAWAHRQQAARQRIVENFTIEQMVKSYRSVWSSSLAHPANCAPVVDR